MNIFQKALRLIGAGGSGGNNLSNGNSEYSGSFLTSVGASTQWWQRYEDERWGHKASADTSALVRGAVDTVATKIASMNLRHERRDPATGVYKAVNGGTQAILDRPCPGLTQSDFIAHLVTELLYFGNTFWAKQVDPRTQRPTSLHPLPPRTQVLLGDGGEIFYESPHLYAEGIFPQPLEDRHLFPERYVAHVRVTDPHNPWVGKSPLSACGIAIHLDDVAKNQAANFLGNKHRVSGFLSTDERLGRDQIMQLRQAFQAQSQGINQGNLPVLGDGLKYQQITNDHTMESGKSRTSPRATSVRPCVCRCLSWACFKTPTSAISAHSRRTLSAHCGTTCATSKRPWHAPLSWARTIVSASTSKLPSHRLA